MGDNMEKDTNSSLVKSSKHFIYGTFLSRIFGMLRDVFMAFFFGSSPHIAAFMVAFRFSNLFRRLFGESTLNSVFVPHFEEIRTEDSKKATHFYRDLLFSIVIVLLIIVAVVEIVLYFWLKKEISADVREIVYLTQVMLPGIFFICLYALNNSLLQCHRRYFLPAVAPVTFNIIWIICVMLFKEDIPTKAMLFLSYGIVLAYFLQWMLTAPSSFSNLEKLTYSEWSKPQIFSLEIRKILKPFVLAILGIGAVQINTALDPIFARFADAQGPAYLWYAMRLYQIPYVMFGIAVANALLPPLARSFKANDMPQFRDFLNSSMIRSMAFMIPCIIGVLMVGGHGVNLIFGRGGFDQISTQYTIKALWAYSLGLFPSALILILASGFYAKKRYFVPAISSVISVIVNIGLNSLFIFVFNMKSISIAMATSIAAYVNCFILYKFLKRENRDLFDSKIVNAFIQITICALIAMIITVMIGIKLQDPSINLLLNRGEFLFSRSFLSQITFFVGYFVLYFGVLIAVAYISKTKEITDLLKRTPAVDINENN